MLLTITKQVTKTETQEVEVKTPAYYKDWVGAFIYINEAKQMVKVNSLLIVIWEPKEGNHYNENVAEVLERGKPCTKEEFEKAYMDVMQKFENAAGIIINS